LAVDLYEPVLVGDRPLDGGAEVRRARGDRGRKPRRFFGPRRGELLCGGRVLRLNRLSGCQGLSRRSDTFARGRSDSRALRPGGLSRRHGPMVARVLARRAWRVRGGIGPRAGGAQNRGGGTSSVQ